MATITLIALPPNSEDAPGVGCEVLGLWLLEINPVFRWRQEHVAFDVRAIGQDDPLPAGCAHLDIPLTEAEYQEYLDAVAYATR